MSAFTKDAIKKAFLQLLEEKSLSKITVKDIADACGVNRNTFYYHFDSIPELVEEIVSDISKELIRDNAAAKSLEECIEIASKIALDNKRVLLNIYNSANRNVYELYLMRACHQVVEQYIQTVFGDKDIDSYDREILIRFYKCQCFGQVIDWMNSSMSYDLGRQLCRLCKLREGFVEEVARRCREGKLDK